jgi:hypothetical protein
MSMVHETFRGQYRKRLHYRGLQEWRNLNMLAVRISVSQVHDLRVCAVLAMRDVLEMEPVITVAMLEVVTAGYPLTGTGWKRWRPGRLSPEDIIMSWQRSQKAMPIVRRVSLLHLEVLPKQLESRVTM